MKEKFLRLDVYEHGGGVVLCVGRRQTESEAIAEAWRIIKNRNRTVYVEIIDAAPGQSGPLVQKIVP